MNFNQQIYNEFNKENSELDIHFILKLLLSNNNFNNKNLKESFLENKIVKSILYLEEESPLIFKVKHESYASIEKLIVIKTTENIPEKFELAFTNIFNNSSFMLEHNKNYIQRKLFLTEELESTLKIPLKPPLDNPFEMQHYFQLNVHSDIKSMSTTMDHVLLENRDLNINSIFSLIGDAIINDLSLIDTFDLLNIQFDFSNDYFKKLMLHFFLEENNINKHKEILKIISNNNNQLKLKNSF